MTLDLAASQWSRITGTNRQVEQSAAEPRRDSSAGPLMTGSSLAIRLVVTPSLILFASLAMRRWGAAIGGWLAGFPFTSAPVVLILALEHGRSFAAEAAVGILLGVLSQVAFALTYAALAIRGQAWFACVL